MTIYKVEYWDSSNGFVWDEEILTLGYFSTEQLALDSGKYVCEQTSKKFKLDYQYLVRTIELDIYYHMNCSPLAKALEEE